MVHLKLADTRNLKPLTGYTVIVLLRSDAPSPERAPGAYTRIPAAQTPLEPARMLICLISFRPYENHMIPDGLAPAAAL